MSAALRSKIVFNAPPFRAPEPRRFSPGPFCNGLAEFCNGKFFDFKNSAALRAGSFPFSSTTDSVSRLRRAAISLSHAAPVLASPQSKAMSAPMRACQGRNMTARSLANPPTLRARMLRTEALFRSPGQVALKVC
jgi:hypothetical protein